MIPISARLLTCASMVTGAFVCDIGTDHAYLPVYLVMSGKCRQAIATDIKEGPLNSAKGTLKRYGVSSSIKLILSDGFDKVNPKGVTDVVIAGLGGENIRDILASKKAEFIRNGINLVLQPMSKAEVLRAWLAENGFAVLKETAVKDNHVYTVMQAHYTGEKRVISEAEAYIGLLNRGELLTKIYIAGVQDRLHTRAHGLEDAGQTAEAEQVRRLIGRINDWLMNGKEPDNGNDD